MNWKIQIVIGILIKKYEQKVGDTQNTIKIRNKPIMENEKEFYVNSS